MEGESSKVGPKFVGFRRTFFDPEKLAGFKFAYDGGDLYVLLWLDGAPAAVPISCKRTNEFIAFAKERGWLTEIQDLEPDSA